MRVSGIIHQQICQLKWHLLACLGLIMLLPIEEAIVNLKEGDGFFSTAVMFPAVMLGPLLAGLIACANVQGDLNEKRYIFWRSKPANVKLLITLKFFIGLIASLLVIACPVVFSFVTNIIWNQDGVDREFFNYYVPLPILVAIMTYSLCFATNVLVRKTARAWLIGMLIGCFLLVLPFMLPLDYKDFVSDVIFFTFGFYLAIIFVASAAAFVFALFAAQHDWHLRTNLKGMLWAGAGLAFALLMLFSSQVANIKILQEKEIVVSLGRRSLDYAGSRVVYQGHSYIDDDKDGISFHKIGSGNVGVDPYGNTGTDSAGRRIHYVPRVAGYRVTSYPWYGKLLYRDAGNEIFSFSIHTYYRTESTESMGREITKYFHEKVYLRSYKRTGESWILACELDLSDYLTDNRSPKIAMRLIGDKIIVFIRHSFGVVDITNPGELKLLDTKLDVLKGRIAPYYRDRREKFIIPIVPVEGISIEEKIKLSIDWYYCNYIHEASIVDVHDGKFAFFFVDYDDIARFDVTRWDKENIYCRFSTVRSLTILEGMTGALERRKAFVKNGRLYCSGDKTLLVFDIRSNRRIRKLGHFVRMNYDIEDIAVLENGNILLCVLWGSDFVRSRSNERKYYLYLLKNPE